MGLFDKVLLGLGLSVGLVIAGIIIWLGFSNAHLKAELAAAQANVTACQLANGEFRDTIEKQNSAVATLKQESEVRQKQNAVSEMAAQKDVQRFQNDAKQLAARKATGEACKAADALFNHFIAGAK